MIQLVIIRGKILLQNLWKLKIGWDDPVPQTVQATWLEFLAQLTELESTNIPKRTGTYKTSSWYLHSFCDASEQAYAVAVYLVVKTEKGISTKLLAT